MSTILNPTVTVTPTGSNGSATGSGASEGVNGLLWGFYVTFAASSAATTDTTITCDGKPLLTLTDVNTSGWYPVQAQAYGVTGSALTGVYTPLPVAGAIDVAVAGADNNKTVTVQPYVVK